MFLLSTALRGLVFYCFNCTVQYVFTAQSAGGPGFEPGMGDIDHHNPLVGVMQEVMGSSLEGLYDFSQCIKNAKIFRN